MLHFHHCHRRSGRSHCRAFRDPLGLVGFHRDDGRALYFALLHGTRKKTAELQTAAALWPPRSSNSLPLGQ